MMCSQEVALYALALSQERSLTAEIQTALERRLLQFLPTYSFELSCRSWVQLGKLSTRPAPG